MVELMVSLTLGLLLTAAVIQSYLSTKQTYRVTEGVSRVQENARFSLHFITKDLRNAGFSSCIGRVRNKLNGPPDEYVSFSSSVTGWEYSGTSSGDGAFTLSGDTLSLPTNAGNWVQKTDSGTSNLPSYLLGKVAAGSDVLWFKNYEELPIIIKEHNDMASPIVTESAHGMVNNAIMLVGNCSEVELFQHLSQGNGKQVSLTAQEGNGDPGNRQTKGTPNWSREYGPEDNMYGFVQTIYYIGEGASGLPSLFRYRTYLPDLAIDSAEISSNAEELVEGVETLQLLFGEDTDSDNNPNTYISADEVTVWDNVVSTRVGVMLRSPQSATDSDQAAEYTLLDSIKLKHAKEDQLLRYSVNSTVKLRNRGLDENLAYYLCNAPSNGGGDKTDDTPDCA